MSLFGPERESIHSRVPVIYHSDKPSRCEPAFAEEADINVIVNRFLRTGQLPTSVVPPQFGDLTMVPVGTDALMAVRRGQMAFEKLPLALRNELGHDMTQFEDWLADPVNFDRAVKWGLLVKKPPVDVPPKPKGGSSSSVQDDQGGGNPPPPK